ncbi:hypothetical protein [Candidatus Uabimicrobium sp. HlEnr_7]|uniref:hypothetical protein n=1 Tax=Candidatus Uabimicrobium helgolandensis TaxID=3095367 RepID=UPI0035588732
MEIRYYKCPSCNKLLDFHLEKLNESEDPKCPFCKVSINKCGIEYANNDNVIQNGIGLFGFIFFAALILLSSSGFDNSNLLFLACLIIATIVTGMYWAWKLGAKHTIRSIVVFGGIILFAGLTLAMLGAFPGSPSWGDFAMWLALVVTMKLLKDQGFFEDDSSY